MSYKEGSVPLNEHNSQAITMMKRELSRIHVAMNECITDSGFVRNECKYKYQMLVEQAKSFQESIAYLEKMYQAV